MSRFGPSAWLVAALALALVAIIAAGAGPPGERVYEQALVQSDANNDQVVMDAAVAAPSGAVAETPVTVQATAEGHDHVCLAGAGAVNKADAAGIAEMRLVAEKRWRAWCHARRARRV